MLNNLIPDSPEILTVSQLNSSVRELLEETFPLIWVEGEISNLSCPSSGHIYFSLKDENAQIRCALFRNRNLNRNLQLENGAHVLVKARVSLYEGRGDFQLIIEHIEEAGDGRLQRAFNLLKQRLAEEGLFNEIHKKDLPSLPIQIGIITSPTGAALRDVIAILKRRFPAIPLIIYPTPVQGEAAAVQITKAIQFANSRNECDVLILTRGGGSLEDLWCFNDENLARTIFASSIPIISAIGHEVDFTIADFVADKRAATPSAAAELASPSAHEWQQNFLRIERRINFLMEHKLKQQTQILVHLQKRLRHPGDLLREQMQRLDYLEQNLLRAIKVFLGTYQTTLKKATLQLQKNNPSASFLIANERTNNNYLRLQQAIKQRLAQAKNELQSSMRALDTVSPLATLERGYAIVSDAKSNKILTSINEIEVNNKIKAKLSKGDLICIVAEKIE